MKNNYFGKILKELRLERNLTQKALAHQLGVVNQTISFWETGQREPDMDMLTDISKFFNIPINCLFGE